RPNEGMTELACRMILMPNAVKERPHSAAANRRGLPREVTNIFQSRSVNNSNAASWTMAAMPAVTQTHVGGTVHNNDKQYAGTQATPISPTAHAVFPACTA